MAIKSIFFVAPAETAKADRGAGAYAISLAKAHGAQLTIFAVALDVTTPGHHADSAPLVASLRSAAEQAGVSCSFITEHTHAIGVHDVVAEYGRVHDLTVIGSDGSGLLSERILAEYLMFESGRPLVLVPGNHVAPYGADVVAVAWDNTAASARAMGDAIALLSPERLTVVSIEGEKPLPTDLDQRGLTAALERRGVKAEHRIAPLGNRPIAVALQEEALAGGASILAMGAYGHSRLRRFVLGSATADVLKNNRIPVLLSH
mgnify:CR=1 FL=1